MGNNIEKLRDFLYCVYKRSTVSTVSITVYNMVPCRFMCVVILLALVAAVFSKSYPRFEFNDTILINNSYIRRGDVGIGPNNSLHCVTDNSGCCNNGEGNWYNYTGSVVQQGTNGGSDLYVTRGDGVVYLNRMTGGSSGMWRCDIPDSSGTQQSIYIYLGTKAQGRLTSSVISFTLDSEPNEDPPEFTLTCRSEGGPATTVEWWRKGDLVQEDSNFMTSQIIVKKSVNTVYNNTLRVKGKKRGLYICTVNNNFHEFVTDSLPSLITTKFVLQATETPARFNATYISNTIVLLEWAYDAAITTVYGYVAYYGNDSVSFNIERNRDTNTYSHTLTGFPTSGVYGISIVARALIPGGAGLPSETVTTTLIVKPPSVSVIGNGSREAGSSYSLICRVTLPSTIQIDQPPNIWWLTPHSSTDPPVEPILSHGSYIANMTLSPLRETDAGNYTCRVWYSFGSHSSPVVTATINVTVLHTGDVSVSVEVVEVDGSGPRVVGSLYTLTCIVTLSDRPASGSSVSIQWQGPAGLSHSDDDVTTDNRVVVSQLALDPLTLAHGGDYTCIAEYTVNGQTASGSGNRAVSVTIPLPSVILRRGRMTDDVILVGEEAVVYCDIKLERVKIGSNITVEVTWLRGSVTLTNSTRVTISAPTGNATSIHSTLTFSPVHLADMATYECHVTVTPLHGLSSPVTTFDSLLLVVTEDESGQAEADSPAGIVAGGITVVILLTAITGLSVFVLLWYKHRHSVQNKYSFTKGNLATSIPGGPVDRERDSGKAEEIEIASVVPTEDGAVETQEDVILEETDDYFQDPTAIMPAIEPVSIERFPDYVRDMLQNKESKLKTEFMTLEKLPKPPSTVAVLPHNKDHNRFKNIYPYDKSRVCLTEAPGVKNSDYINASFIDSYGGRKNAYIAAQGPVEASVERFWRMVWEYKLQTIVMLTQCTEAGKIKCVCYWPEKLHDSVTVDKKFRVTYSSNIPFAEYEFRKFKLENLTEPDSKYMTVSHLHYTAWPDHGVPENVMSLIAFIRHLRKLHPISQPQPLLVHCSAGVGRTGTLILLDIVMQQMKAEGCIGVNHWLRMMRMQRMKMVQSQQQYKFIHCGLSEFVVCGETEVAAADLRITTKNLKKTADHGMTGFQKQLQIIDEVSPHYIVSYADAKQEYNKNKNRFPDKLPNDMYRVRLRCGLQPGSDYINASFISGYKQKRAYIAAQCPLKSTVADFWRMVNEFQCGCVVMLCELEEEEQESSYHFWPKEEGDSEVHGKLTVNLQSVKTLGDIVTRHLNMVDGSAALNQAKRVTMLQLTSWPMKGLPHTSAVLSLIEKLTAAQMKSSNKRTIVMCSDGMSRTGTFLTIHSQIERLKTEGVVDFLQAIKSARLQRAGLVLNEDHYAFCHEVLNTFLDNFDTYANFVEFKEVI